jgi:flagellar export protein FliJ
MSLDALRKLRARTEEALTMELARATQALIGMEQRHDAVDAQIQAEASAYRIEAERGLVIEAMLEWQGRLDSYQAALRQARGAIDRLTEEWNRARVRLIEATQERKALDRFIERQREAQRAELRRREQQVTDEAAGRCFVLRRS